MNEEDLRPSTPVKILPDPVIEAYKVDVDRSLLVRNLRMTPSDRLAQLESMAEFVASTRGRGGCENEDRVYRSS
ncbi:hypothetical protein Pan189_39320 [Stratiformator vulcanicus]|uniref:Uncharacterized protein n=1 Tax=Stratiformator vulcanicus TaxID=2527980 RepID=A0A517R6J4_9PLAN|nr:hypothetical protein Pan189_39320 [Stratiformator vulcanicus]